MKPPQAANRGHGCLLLLTTLVALSVGCRQSTQEPSGPAKSTPAAGAESEAGIPSTESAKDQPAAPSEGPSLEALARQPSPEAPSPTEEPSEAEPKETPAAPAPIPSIELPPAAVPEETPKEEPSPSEPAPSDESPSPPAETPSAETPSADSPSPPAAAQEPAAPETEAPAPSEEPSEEPSEPEAPPPTPGPPLGEDVAKLTPLQPAPTVWIDKKGHRVIAVGRVCQRNAPLEMFACPSGTKEHEAIVAIPARSEIIHAALLRVGATPGKPVQFYPEYVPANGTEVAIDVRWKDEKGEVHTAKAQDWVRNIVTKKPLEYNWVFGGSNFWTDEETGKEHYSGNAGDLICVSNFPSATLDLPIESSQSDANLVFEAFTERIPPLGTPVTIVLKPNLKKKPATEPAKAAKEEPEPKKTESEAKPE